MLRRVATVIVAMLAVLLPSSAAFADNCFNASRPAPSGNQPTSTGRWVWLPSIGIDFPAWGFEPPANYQNGNPDAWLLSKTPYCAAGGFVNPGGTNRTYTHGIQSGCGAFG